MGPLHDLSVPSNLGSSWLLVLSEAAVCTLTLVWGILDYRRAKSVAEYVVCPFIDFLNHSSQSQVHNTA
jgi:hypothetical protein